MLLVVAARPTERTGFLVIRAWIEANGRARLRARITRTLNLDRREEVSTVVATAEEITDAVTQWVDDFVSGDGSLTDQ